MMLGLRLIYAYVFRTYNYGVKQGFDVLPVP